MKPKKAIRTTIPATAFIAQLKKCANPANAAGMRRFGIQGSTILGISIPTLRAMAKQTGKNHEVALALWKSGIHEARILAAYVDEPDAVTPEQMDAWAADFESWDVCDQVCGNLFDRTPHAYEKALEWSRDEREFVKRAGFALMATLAWHDKTAPDANFGPFFDRIRAESRDGRNFVKKAVNWALRQIGKRNPTMRKKAIRTAEDILKTHAESKAARWVARDALRELRKPE